MRARGVVGHKIVAIKQERFYNTMTQQWTYELQSITLDNGLRIILMAHETEQEPYVEGVVA
jgi:hypothetical protein